MTFLQVPKVLPQLVANSESPQNPMNSTMDQNSICQKSRLSQTFWIVCIRDRFAGLPWGLRVLRFQLLEIATQRYEVDVFRGGLPGLCKRLAEQVKQGNVLVKCSLRIFRLAIVLGIPVILENPATSRLFLVPEVRRLLASSKASLVITDQCQHGTSWRKPTGFLTAGIRHHLLEPLSVRRHGHQQLCSRTGRKHIQLSGTAPSGMCWTRIAQVYPHSLCKKIAKSLIDSLCL